MLIAVILFVFILLSGCVFCRALLKCSFEEALPLSCMGAVFVLFLFGLAGALSAGVYFLLALAVAVIPLTAVRLVKAGRLSEIKKPPLTLALFLLLCVLLLVFNVGREFVNWDDFSHWGDAVKVMTTLHVFNANPLSDSLFPEYPPGVTLFEYLLQELLVITGRDFNEGLVFFCHQLFLYAMLFPFLKKLDLRKPYSYLLIALLFLCPLPFYPDLFPQLKVDAVLGVLFACALARILTSREKNALYYAHVWMSIAMLVLVKTSGFLLALLAATTLLLSECMESKNLQGNRPRRISRCFSGFGAALVPYLLWEGFVRLNHAKKAFSLKIDFSSPSGLLGQDAYRVESLRQFIKAFFSRGVTSDEALIGGLPPVLLFVLTMGLLYYLLSLYRRRFPEKSRLYKSLFWLIFVSFVVYFAGLSLAYMFSFSVNEALELAALQRYIGTIFLAGACLLLLLVIDLIHLGELHGTRVSVLLFCVWAAVTPWLSVMRYAVRSNVRFSVEYRRESDALVESYRRDAGDGAYRVYVLSSTPSDHLTMHYQLRPSGVNGPERWWNEPILEPEEGESYASAWQKELKESYDYVLIFDLNEELINSFGPVFTDPDSVEPYSAYRVDKDTGLLIRCE